MRAFVAWRDWYGGRPVKVVEVEELTEKHVRVAGGKRKPRVCGSYGYFRSWREAIDCQARFQLRRVRVWEFEVVQARLELERLEARLAFELEMSGWLRSLESEEVEAVEFARAFGVLRDESLRAQEGLR